LKPEDDWEEKCQRHRGKIVDNTLSLKEVILRAIALLYLLELVVSSSHPAGEKGLWFIIIRI
jgi:hypothetical protein